MVPVEGGENSLRCFVLDNERKLIEKSNRKEKMGEKAERREAGREPALEGQGQALPPRATHCAAPGEGSNPPPQLAHL